MSDKLKLKEFFIASFILFNPERANKIMGKNP